MSGLRSLSGLLGGQERASNVGLPHPLVLDRLKPELISGGKKVETEPVLLWAPPEKAGFSGKDNQVGKVEGSRRRGRMNVRWTDSLKETTGLCL